MLITAYLASPNASSVLGTATKVATRMIMIAKSVDTPTQSLERKTYHTHHI